MAKLPTEIEVDLEEEVYTIYDDPTAENLREEAEELYNRLKDWMSNYIGHQEGFGHQGFELKIKITASHIMWDTDED